MAYGAVNLPLTGAGDATAAPAVDLIGGFAYQTVKVIDGLEGSTNPVRALGTTPGSTDHGMVTRPIGSTAHKQAVIMSSQQTVTVGNPTAPATAVDVANIVGVIVGNPTTAVNVANPTTSVNVANPTTSVNVANPTTSVSLSSQVTVTVGNPTTAITVSNPTTAVDLTSAGSTRSVGTVNQGSPGGSSADAWWVRTVSTQTGAAGSTTVDANLTSAGSTRLVGQVSVTSGVVLGAGSSTNVLGAVAQGAGSTTVAPWYVISSGGGAGSTVVDVTTSTAQRGSFALASGTTGTMGAMAQGPGSSANYWLMQALGFTSALTSRTTANTSANAAVVSASTAVLGMLIQNMTTVDVGLSLSTAAPSTALANVDIVLSGRNVAGGGSRIVFGGYDMPNFTGNIRGITIGSTTVSGGVVVTRFLSS